MTILTSQATSHLQAPNWLQTLSYGGLRQPSEYWFNGAQKMENEFRAYHETGLRKHRHVIKSFANRVSKHNKDVPQAAILLFFRTRTFIRLHYLNRQSAAAAANKKRFTAKKMKKVTQ